MKWKHKIKIKILIENLWNLKKIYIYIYIYVHRTVCSSESEKCFVVNMGENTIFHTNINFIQMVLGTIWVVSNNFHLIKFMGTFISSLVRNLNPHFFQKRMVKLYFWTQTFGEQFNLVHNCSWKLCICNKDDRNYFRKVTILFSVLNIHYINSFTINEIIEITQKLKSNIWLSILKLMLIVHAEWKVDLITEVGGFELLWKF